MSDKVVDPSGSVTWSLAVLCGCGHHMQSNESWDATSDVIVKYDWVNRNSWVCPQCGTQICIQIGQMSGYDLDEYA